MSKLSRKKKQGLSYKAQYEHGFTPIPNEFWPQIGEWIKHKKWSSSTTNIYGFIKSKHRGPGKPDYFPGHPKHTIKTSMSEIQRVFGYSWKVSSKAFHQMEIIGVIEITKKGKKGRMEQTEMVLSSKWREEDIQKDEKNKVEYARQYQSWAGNVGEFSKEHPGIGNDSHMSQEEIREKVLTALPRK